MKHGISGCIIVILLISAASAATISPGLFKQTIRPAAIANVPVSTTAAITFDSNVHGATVYLDGELLGVDEPNSRTPVTDNTVTAGGHSAEFRLAGYRSSHVNFTVVAGKDQTIYAQLQSSISVGNQKNLSGEIGLQQQHVTFKPVTINGDLITPVPSFQTTPPTPAKSPLAREITVIPTLQPVGGKQSGDSGLTQPDTSGDAGDGSSGGYVPEPDTQTTHIGFLDSFLGMFSGLFGHTTEPKPPASVTIVGPTINPTGVHVIGSYWVAPVIGPGATVYIGEESLNVTHALNEAYGIEVLTPGALDRPPALTRIGWFVADPSMTTPTKIIDLGVSGRYKSMKVAPEDFAGYTGTWYLLDSSGTHAYSNNAGVFTVRDPALSLKVTNAGNGADVSGTTVHVGDQLRFSITKNIGVVSSAAGNLRSPITSSVNDGFMDIVVTAPGSRTLTQLDVMSGSTPGIESLSRLCWNLPSDDSCNPSFSWNTGAMYGNGTAKYPAGTYTVQAISKLNGMQDNYRNAGQIYTGKTASQPVTFTLA